MALIGNIKKIQLPSGSEFLIYDENTRLMITSKQYDAHVAYSEGDLVVYDNYLYRVTADITTTGNTGWSAVSKTATTVDEELDRVYVEINAIKKAVTQVMRYLGVTSTALFDGATTSSIVIGDVTWTAGNEYNPDTHVFTSGAVVISGSGSAQKEYAWNGTSWNEFGETGLLKQLAYKDADEVFYQKTTSATSSAVTGVGSISPKTKRLTATASNGQATIKTTAPAITGFGTHTTVDFIKSYPGETSKLVTTTIRQAGNDVSVPNVTNVSSVTATNTVFGTDTTASKATAGTILNVAKKKAQATTVSKIGSGTTTSILETASVSNDTLILGAVPVSNPSINECADDTQSITPYTFTDVTVPVVSSNTSVDASSVTLGESLSCAGAGSNTTVATGSVSSNASGGTVMVGLGTATTDSAIKTLGTPTTAACATAIELSTQPTITLADTATTGGVPFVYDVDETPFNTTPTITLGYTDEAVTTNA